jgi:hypothetical protein
MKVEEFDKLCCEIDFYNELAREDIKKISYLSGIKSIYDNQEIITKLESFLYDAFNGNLQTERKVKEAPKYIQNRGWYGCEKIGVGTFFGVIHSYRKTIGYFNKKGYFFKLIPEYLPLILDLEKRKIIKEFINFKDAYKKAFESLGILKGKVLSETFYPPDLIINEPVNFFAVTGSNKGKRFSVSYNPFKINKIRLNIDYQEIFNESGRDGVNIYLLIYGHNNKVYSAFNLRDFNSSDEFSLHTQETYLYSNSNHIDWAEEPFTITSYSDILNLPSVKEKISNVINIFKYFKEQGSSLMAKHAKLLLIKGVL